MAEPFNPYDIQPGTQVIVNVNGVIYRAISNTTASPTDVISSANLEIVADPTFPPAGNYTVVTTPPDPGEVQVISAGAAGITGINASYSAGVGDFAPLGFAAWADHGDWNWDASTDNLTISTAVERIQIGVVQVPTRPASYVVSGLSDDTFPITVELRFRQVGIGAASVFPANADYTESLSGDGGPAGSTAVFDLTGLAPPPGEGLGMRVDFKTKGGGQADYAVKNHWFVF